MHNGNHRETLQSEIDLAMIFGAGQEDLFGDDERVLFAETQGAVSGNTSQVYLIASGREHLSWES
jgi:hypothetical protein